MCKECIYTIAVYILYTRHSIVSELEKAIQSDADMTPIIVHYVDGEFELNDGNHRHKAYENLGVQKVWAIVWITEDEELEDFMSKYGEYVKDSTIIRR